MNVRFSMEKSFRCVDILRNLWMLYSMKNLFSYLLMCQYVEKLVDVGNEGTNILQ